jgi:hypothetical protein
MVSTLGFGKWVFVRKHEMIMTLKLFGSFCEGHCHHFLLLFVSLNMIGIWMEW